MPVFIKNGRRVLYVHVPKTGGTTIEMLFERNGFAASFLDRRITQDSLLTVMRCSPQHMHAPMLQCLFSVPSFHFVFMTVRHPVARLVSEYRMLARGNPALADFDVWVDTTLGAWPATPFMLDNHIRPQVDFWLPGSTVFKLESGFDSTLIARLASAAGCSFEDSRLPVQNGSKPGTVIVPSAGSIRRIVDFYHRDFEKFGYPTSV